jgi:hypothetical protein
MMRAGWMPSWRPIPSTPPKARWSGLNDYPGFDLLSKRAGEERGEATRAYIARVMRGFQQDVEAMANPDPPITFWVEKLSKE